MEREKRSQEVIDAVVRNKAVYFAPVGGAARCCQNVLHHRKLLLMKILVQKRLENLQ